LSEWQAITVCRGVLLGRFCIVRMKWTFVLQPLSRLQKNVRVLKSVRHEILRLTFGQYIRTKRFFPRVDGITTDLTPPHTCYTLRPSHPSSLTLSRTERERESKTSFIHGEGVTVFFNLLVENENFVRCKE